MSILYNVTIKVDHSIAAEWRIWMLKEHIPMLLKTGCFEEAKLYRLLEQDDTDGPTFSAQYIAANKAQYDTYIDTYAQHMRAETLNKWGNKLVAFRSVMQIQS